MVANLSEAKIHPVAPDAFLRHDSAIRIALRAHEDTSAALARAKKAAKGDAVDLFAYKMMERVRKLDDDEQIIVVRHFIQYMQFLEMPVGTQFSMIDAPKIPKAQMAKAKAEQSAFDAGENGLRAGRDGDPASMNPHAPGSGAFAAWARSHAAGLAERATAGKMADTEQERPADVAPATKRAAQGRGRPPNGAREQMARMNSGRTNGGASAH